MLPAILPRGRRPHEVRRLFLILVLLVAAMAWSGCASVQREPSPPGTVTEKLERAGERYQASEAVPSYRDSRPNESAPVSR